MIQTNGDPRKRLEALLQAAALIIGYFYIYVYQDMLHIKVPLFSLQSLLRMPIVAIIIMPLIHYIIVKADPLQRSPSQRKTIRFFQKEFPSKYLLERCRKCIYDQKSCRSYITEDSYDHVRYWFQDILHGSIEKKNPKIVKDTYRKGYICKLLYYLSWILIGFCLLATITIIFYHIYLCCSKTLELNVTALQVFFPLTCVGIWTLIKILHKPSNNKPSGCWQAWREINRMHVGWLRNNEVLLVNLICKANGNDKQFREKASGSSH